MLEAVTRLNRESSVTGVIVQLPLPSGVRAETVQEALDPRKDVEGVHPANLGALVGDQARLVPCTAAAVIACLDAAGRGLAGLDAVVIGRSRIVGRPVALLLVQRHATVTICHRKTRDLAAHLLRADLVVAAAGQTAMVGPSMVKPGAIVIDVGTNEVVRDGKRGLAGDVDPAVAEVAGWFTPVPGGVGPVTVALLWKNALEAWKLDQAAEGPGRRRRTGVTAPSTGRLRSVRRAASTIVEIESRSYAPTIPPRSAGSSAPPRDHEVGDGVEIRGGLAVEDRARRRLRPLGVRARPLHGLLERSAPAHEVLEVARRASRPGPSSGAASRSRCGPLVQRSEREDHGQASPFRP